MTRLSRALNAGAALAGLVALAAIIGAFGSLFGEAPAAGPHWTGHEQLAEAAQLIESEPRSE